MKHSKGKWLAWNGSVYAGGNFKYTSTHLEGMTHKVCDCDTMGDIPKSEEYANARLIAVAPEMLNMLDVAIAHIKDLQERRVNDSNIIISRIDTLIKKATMP